MFSIVPVPTPRLSPGYEVHRKSILVRRLPWPSLRHWRPDVLQFQLLDRGSDTLEGSKIGTRFFVRIRIFEVLGELPEGTTSKWMQITKDAWGYDSFRHEASPIVQELFRAGRANLISLAQLTLVSGDDVGNTSLHR